MAAQIEQKDDNDIISSINITPMVDIILVLLIIFMVTASIIVTPAFKVDLPKASNTQEKVESPLTLSLTKDGELFLNGKKADDTLLQSFISSALTKNKDLVAIISADKQSFHGDVIHLIDIIKGMGVTKIALNIEKSAP